jgi:hypothetical protein
MPSEGIRRARMLPLREVVDRYLSTASRFNTPVALSAFTLSEAETETLFSTYEEDYHISRFLHFTRESGKTFSINGFPATHVSIDAEIETLL